jgi:hypothetical protein
MRNKSRLENDCKQLSLTADANRCSGKVCLDIQIMTNLTDTKQ